MNTAMESDFTERDLNHPDYNPASCPAWAKEKVPDWVQPYRGINGLPDDIRESLHRWYKGGPNAVGTEGIDRYQANQFIPYRPETAEYLYTTYTPATVGAWKSGYLPVLFNMAQAAVNGCTTASDKALAILNGPCRALKHPCIPPLGEAVSAGRNLDEDALLASGTAWCNEQARVFVRMCQATGVPARIIHYFYAEIPSGHTVAEFYDGMQWCLVDTSYFLTFPNGKGRLLSAAQCHDGGSRQAHAQSVCKAGSEELVKQIERLLIGDSENTQLQRALKIQREIAIGNASTFRLFAVMNYPLP